MPGFRLRRAAQADVEHIGEYTLGRWGADQAVRYLTGLDACFGDLVDSSWHDRPYRGPYLKREYGSHVVFFRRDSDGSVVIVRVLHESMVPERHLDPGRDDESEEK